MEYKVGTLYPEVTEGLHAYGVASHRHMPEIEQGLSEAAGADVQVCAGKGTICCLCSPICMDMRNLHSIVQGTLLAYGNGNGDNAVILYAVS